MKEIWNLLEVTHEDPYQVKESIISLLTHICKVFKMEKNETINDMFNRFNSIVVGLEGVGKTIGKVEFNHKLFLSFL